MKLNNLKRTIAASVFGVAAMLGTTEAVSAQNNRQVQRQQQRAERQNQRIDKQRDRIDNQRERLAAQRQRAEQERLQLAQQRQRQQQILLEQQRQQQILLQQQRNRNVYANRNNNNRYRVYRNGGYYQTDNRGAELLRQAVNRGYQEGVRAGQADRNNRRGSSWGNSSVYRSGNYGYQSYVDSSQYQYYFRQGFERGYQDGYNSRYQYGSNSGGAFNILGTILQGILNIQQF